MLTWFLEFCFGFLCGPKSGHWSNNYHPKILNNSLTEFIRTVTFPGHSKHLQDSVYEMVLQVLTFAVKTISVALPQLGFWISILIMNIFWVYNIKAGRLRKYSLFLIAYLIRTIQWCYRYISHGSEFTTVIQVFIFQSEVVPNKAPENLKRT